MTYTGEVSPGGPADTREAGDLVITKVAVDEEMSNNCYLLRCASTGDQVLIDAAASPSVLLELIGDGGLTHVITTHQHWDHHRALADVVAATGAEVVAGGHRRIRHHGADRSTRHDVRRGRRHHPGRLLLAARDPAHRPHSRLDRARVRRRLGYAAPLHRRLALPRRRRQHPWQRRELPARCSTTSRRSCSARSPTRPGSTPATATTRPSAPSVRGWRSGASGAGDRSAPLVEEVAQQPSRNQRRQAGRRVS